MKRISPAVDVDQTMVWGFRNATTMAQATGIHEVDLVQALREMVKGARVAPDGSFVGALTVPQSALEAARTKGRAAMFTVNGAAVYVTRSETPDQVCLWTFDGKKDSSNLGFVSARSLRPEWWKELRLEPFDSNGVVTTAQLVRAQGSLMAKRPVETLRREFAPKVRQYLATHPGAKLNYAWYTVLGGEGRRHFAAS